MSDNIRSAYEHTLADLPSYCNLYFAWETSHSVSTKLAYAKDLYIFFNYLITKCSDRFSYGIVSDIPLESLKHVNSSDILLYLEYLSSYTVIYPNGTSKTYSNSGSGKKRKLAPVKNFFRYLKLFNHIDEDPTSHIKNPSPNSKAVVILSEKQQDHLIKEMQTGSRKSERQLVYHENTKYRDTAILLTFLGTGVRVSELVNMNIFDIDFEEQCISIIRKGSKKEFVYFNDSVLSILADYIDYERRKFIEGKGDPDANGPLFLSNRGTRISVDRVEGIIKEAAKRVLPENIDVSCHTLRKTYGSYICREYGIHLAQMALGHSDVSTTSKYYIYKDNEQLKDLKNI